MNPTLSIVITCHGEARELPCILHQLNNQRKNIEVPDSNTGKPVKWGMGEYFDHGSEVIVSYDGLRSRYDSEYNYDYMPFMDNFKVICTPYLDGPTNVGHHTRGPGIEAARGEFIVLTNQDNYFMAGWADRVISSIKLDTGMVAWNCVNNLWGWNSFQSKITRGHIDLCCVAVRADIAKEVGFPFRNYDGDFDYIEACYNIARQKKLDRVFLREVLTTHN